MRNTVLIWAGGTWMSGVAWILYDLWYWENLICLDSNKSELTQKLQQKWIKVIIWDNKYTPEITDNVIYSEACIGSPEVQIAKSYIREPKQNRFIWNYFDFLWEISKYFNTVWITWTNWKSTSTSLAIYTAKEHLDDFWLWILWALVPDLDWNNYYLNSDKKTDIKNIFDQILNWKWLDTSLIKKYTFILEACEYKRHFLKLDIDRWIITNIELDHTDYYKDLNDCKSAFLQFSKRVKNKIITIDSSLRDEWNESWQSIKHKFINTNIQNFNFTHIFWEHNNQNWSLVLKLIQELNLIKHPSLTERGAGGDFKTKLQKTIEEFKWLRRRLEFLENSKKWSLIFSDYWHMASSIKICHQAIQNKYPNQKITAIFQPHQAARIIEWRNDFPKALKLYDDVIIFDIYAARENLPELLKNSPIKWIQDIDELWQKLAEKSNGIYTKDIKKIEQTIKKWQKNEIFAIFTAWDLDFKIRNILKK